MRGIFLLLVLALMGSLLNAEENNPPLDSSLSFLEAIDAILKRNPQLAIQKNALELTQSQNLPSHYALLPTLSLSAAQTYNIIPGVLNEQVRTYQASTNFNVFRFGSDVSAMRAANAEEESKKHLVNDVILRTETTATHALVERIRTQKTKTILKKISDGRDVSLQIARERYERGLLALQEVNKVIVDADNTKARYQDAEIETVKASAQLTNFLGHDRVQTEWPWARAFDTASPGGPLAQEPDFSQRPDWQAARKKVEGASYRLGESWGKVLPSLDLNLTYGYGQDLIANQNGPAVAGGITLTIPLFDRLSNYGDYRGQIAKRSTAEIEFEQVKRQARADWESSQGTFETALTSAKARDKTLETSRKIFDDNLRRFRQGLVSANDLVFDSDRLAASEIFSIQGWAAVHETFVARCHAQGLKIVDCLSKLTAYASRPLRKAE